jgi:sarcosine reductase
VLGDFQIVASSMLPQGAGGLMVARHAFIDFWGSGALWGPFGATHTLALDLTLSPDLQDKAAATAAIRRALITLSTEIGALCTGATGREEMIPAVWERPELDLPRVAYVYQVQSQDAPLETFLYGANLDDLYPTLLDPVEILDGALVSGNHGLQTTPTISHCTNPGLRRLLAEHGRGLSPCSCCGTCEPTARCSRRRAAACLSSTRCSRSKGRRRWASAAWRSHTRWPGRKAVIRR